MITMEPETNTGIDILRKVAGLEDLGSEQMTEEPTMARPKKTAPSYGQWPSELVEAHGEAVHIEGKKVAGLNDKFWAKWIAQDCDIITDKSNSDAYIYCPATGIWDIASEADITLLVIDFIQAQIKKRGLSETLGKFAKTNPARSVAYLLKSTTKTEDPFNPDFHKDKILTKNGLIKVNRDMTYTFKPLGWKKEERWKFRINANYEKEANCVKFLELLNIGFQGDHEIINQIQLVLGQCLLGINYYSRAALWWGEAESGKTVILEVISEILQNVRKLRPENIEERFEMDRYKDCVLLKNSEIEQILTTKAGINTIKTILGGDAQETETKNSSIVGKFKGDKNMILVRNEPFLVDVDGTRDANSIRRRILPMEWTGVRPNKEIEDRELIQTIVNTEGSGILNWGLVGACKILQMLEEKRSWKIPKKMAADIDFIISASDSLRTYLVSSLEIGQNEIEQRLIWEDYIRFCHTKGWTAFEKKRFTQKMPDLMRMLFGCSQSRSIPSLINGRATEGFRGIKFKPVSVPPPIIVPDVSAITNSL